MIAEEVIKAVAEHTSIDVEDLLGRRRFVPIVRARVMACMLLREGGMTRRAAQKVFMRDYTTIWHYENVHDADLATNPDYKRTYETLRKKVLHT